ncbi:MAG: hypothetical protein GSR86_02840 [Desulfurococcales archaeon]|nr:hypothetical protein [Desulfurococcales archaeon]
MVVTVEISGVLEEKLRRLVELGVYSSVAEAVRDAVRSMIERMDLVDVAITLYTSKGASFQYAAYFANKPYNVMIDLMLAREIMPLLGARSDEELGRMEPGTYVIDPLTAYVIYGSDLYYIIKLGVDNGYRFIMPDAGRHQLEVYMARRMASQGEAERLIHLAPIPVPTEPPRSLVTPIEEAIANYAEAAGVPLVSEDIRTRDYASKRGVSVYSMLSLIRYAVSKGLISFERALEIVYSIKAVPLLVPDTVIPGEA